MWLLWWFQSGGHQCSSSVPHGHTVHVCSAAALFESSASSLDFGLPWSNTHKQNPCASLWHAFVPESSGSSSEEAHRIIEVCRIVAAFGEFRLETCIIGLGCGRKGELSDFWHPRTSEIQSTIPRGFSDAIRINNVAVICKNYLGFTIIVSFNVTVRAVETKPSDYAVCCINYEWPELWWSGLIWNFIVPVGRNITWSAVPTTHKHVRRTAVFPRKVCVVWTSYNRNMKLWSQQLNGIF